MSSLSRKDTEFLYRLYLLLTSWLYYLVIALCCLMFISWLSSLHGLCFILSYVAYFMAVLTRHRLCLVYFYAYSMAVLTGLCFIVYIAYFIAVLTGLCFLLSYAYFMAASTHWFMVYVIVHIS